MRETIATVDDTTTMELGAHEWEEYLLNRRGPHETREWITVPEAAAYLHVADETVRNHIKSGRIQGVRRYGNRYRIPITSFAAYLAKTRYTSLA